MVGPNAGTSDPKWIGVYFYPQADVDSVVSSLCAELAQLRAQTADRSRISMLETLLQIEGTNNEIIETAADEIRRLRDDNAVLARETKP